MVELDLYDQIIDQFAYDCVYNYDMNFNPTTSVYN